jgi:hypothetical protein
MTSVFIESIGQVIYTNLDIRNTEHWYIYNNFPVHNKKLISIYQDTLLNDTKHKECPYLNLVLLSMLRGRSVNSTKAENYCVIQKYLSTKGKIYGPYRTQDEVIRDYYTNIYPIEKHTIMNDDPTGSNID